jgi:hypothetical protein
VKPTWNSLTLGQIDLHYHAGNERPVAYSLEDVVSYAHATGRRILGITDHWGFYTGSATKHLPHYPGNAEGFAQFGADVAKCREAHPDMFLAFGAEIHLRYINADSCDGAFAPPEIDYFLGEPDACAVGEGIGNLFIHGFENMARLRDKHGKPCYFAHPLRDLVNTYVSKTGPGPMYPKHLGFGPLSNYSDPLAHVEEIFDIRIADLARASKEYDIPLEINESSWGRILGHNAEWFTERYLFFFRAMLDMDVEVVLGSDQHNMDEGACTPFTVAKLLGVKPKDMKFLRHWLGNPVD